MFLLALRAKLGRDAQATLGGGGYKRGVVRRSFYWVLAAGVLVVLYGPMVAVGLLSFRESKLGFAAGGWSGKWYVAVWKDETVWSATKNTLVVGVVSALIATVLGTGLAIGRARMRRRGVIAGAVEGVVMLPVVVPDVVMAAALVAAFGFLRAVTGVGMFGPGLPMVVAAHVTLEVAFVGLIVAARLETLPGEVGEAASDLYASWWFELTRVTLPLLFPAILAGALVAFVLSVDDFVLAFFTTGPGSGTLPVYIYGSVKRGISPELHALSTVMTAVTLVAVGVAVWLGKGRRSGSSSA